MKPFKPAHINATNDDLQGNNGIGRYVLLPGSDGRAQAIAKHFDRLTVKPHPRGHNLYLGSIENNGKFIDVATIASGMGCPSMEIILHELHHLGAKRFLRMGTAGSLQVAQVKIGDIVNVQAAVRDERTSRDYAPLAVPAVASIEVIKAVAKARTNFKFDSSLHTGTVHCKSSFYAREFFEGPKSVTNKTYTKVLKQCGVLASEMETSALFIQSQIYNQQLQEQGRGPKHRVLHGAILGIIAEPPDQYASADEVTNTINQLIKLGIETMKVIAVNDDAMLTSSESVVEYV